MKEDFLTELKKVDNFTFTENGAVALKSTGSAMLDAFGTMGAMMHASCEDILNKFYKAYAEDKDLAIKLLFYLRDVRGGQGLRRLFRIILRSLAFYNTSVVEANMDNILFFGRGDDYLCLLGTPAEYAMIKCITTTLAEDSVSVLEGGSCSLLAKWLPSENTSSKETRLLAKEIRKKLGLSSKEYRKLLSKLRSSIGIVESKMSANKWDEIDFEKLPSKAAMIYADAFMKHVQDNYIGYLKDLAAGNAKVNANALFPVDIIDKVRSTMYNPSLKDKYLYDAMWKALPDYFGDNEETGICVVDTSGSMWGTPINVALSLGLYCADKAKGPFHNHFITFSAYPKLQGITGENIYEKIHCMESSDWGMNTNIEAVFNLILKVAINQNLPQEDLPSKLYIISDMQFDEATTSGSRNMTFMDKMRENYSKAGYELPSIIYWDVNNSECGMFQQDKNGENCCMVSGYSPSLFKSIIEGTEYEEEVTATGETVIKQKLDPMHIMLTTLNNERYDRVITNV